VWLSQQQSVCFTVAVAYVLNNVSVQLCFVRPAEFLLLSSALHTSPLRPHRQALQRLTEAAEKAKIELSALTQTSINLPFITATAEGPKHIDVNLSKAQFEQLCSDLLDRVRRPVEQSLRDAKLSISDINEVRGVM
jgi:molecular chaperone DnaK (HSP70)